MSSDRPSRVSVNMLDLVSLLYHVHKGATHPRVGFEDCERTLKKLTEELSPRRIQVPLAAIESALWSCNLMDEQQEWWSPQSETFERFSTRLLDEADSETKFRFNRIYNTIRSLK